jgi:ABC-type transporter Mla subunit MlaD
MGLKDFGTKIINWLRTRSFFRFADYQPQINEEGLIATDINSPESTVDSSDKQKNQVVVKTVQPKGKAESLEKLQVGFDRLIDKLQGINEHLNHQVTQHEDLMGRMEKLPQLLESFPAIVENQKQLTQQLLAQLEATSLKDQQFIDAVEKIPSETAKQTDALTNIDHQLAAAADTDTQVVENFNKFNQSLENLNQSTVSQRDSIMQMSRTFAASDRYLKYIISRQNKRFMWIFVITVTVCLLAIMILTCIIIYLKQ